MTLWLFLLLKHLRLIDLYRTLYIGMKIKQTVMVLALLMGLGGLFVGPVASAGNCGGVTTLIFNCLQSGGPSPDPTKSGAWGILTTAIQILTAGVGVAAVAGIVWGSILFTTAGGKPDHVKKANMVLTNTVLGIIIYAVMVAFLNFIIPGGVFG